MERKQSAAEDTDILVMIKHHWDVDMEDIYFMTTTSKGKGNSRTIFWSASKTNQQFDHSHILPAHVWTGCHITSAIHQKGKLTFTSDVMYSQHAICFMKIL